MKEILKHIPPKGIDYWYDETDLIEPVDGHKPEKSNLVRETVIFTPRSNSYPEED